jgi:hypothetical protein
MGTNEHNAIAIRINKLQNIWIKERQDKAQLRLFHWEYNEEDYFFLNSFLKLESSAYGKTGETFVVFFNDFNNPTDYTFSLIKEWLVTFEKEAKINTDWKWADFDSLNEEFKKLEPKNYDILKLFFEKMLISFKAFEGKKENLLILGIMPRVVNDQNGINAWINEMLSLLPINIGIVIAEVTGKKMYSKAINFCKEIAITLQLPNQNLKGAYKELATQGNPSDPQVKFRKCFFEMGEAAAAGSREKIDFWGKQMLDVTQSTGIRSFWASAYLIYAGFLFKYKDNQVHTLLDKGIKITHSEYKQNPDSAGVLLQLYSYKGSYHSYCSEKELAIDWFVKQAQTAQELEMKEQAVTAYLYALLVAEKNKNERYSTIVKEGFDAGYALDNEILKTINFALIAHHYISTEVIEPNFELEVRTRLATIYGEDWESNVHKTKKMATEHVVVEDN